MRASSRFCFTRDLSLYACDSVRLVELLLHTMCLSVCDSGRLECLLRNVCVSACDSLWLMPKIGTRGSVSGNLDRLVMAGVSSKLCKRCASLSQHHRKSQGSSVTHRWHVLVETMVGSSARESINPCHRCLLLSVCRSEQHVVCNALRAMSRAERLLRNICRSAFASQCVSVCLPATPSDKLIPASDVTMQC